MSTAAEQLQQIVEDVARSGALTPAAITQFDTYRKRVEELEKVIATHEQWREYAGKQIEQLSSLARERLDTITNLTKERDALKAKEAAMDKAIWVAEFEKDRRGEMRTILSDVFRNVEVNRSITRSSVIPPQHPSQYNSCPPPGHLQQHTDTETTREG